jgi:hypothetical protein
MWQVWGTGEVHTEFLTWEPERKRPLRRPRRRREDNIKMNQRGVGWIHLDEDKIRWRAPVNTVMNLQIP